MEKESKTEVFKIGRATVERQNNRGPIGQNALWHATITRKGRKQQILDGYWHEGMRKFVAPVQRNNLLTQKIIKFINSYESLKG